MKRYAVVLTVGTAALLAGCSGDPAARPAGRSAAIPHAPTASAPVAPVSTPAGKASPAPVERTSSRPANALGWAQPSLSNEDLDRAVRITWAGNHGVAPERVRGDQLLLGLADKGALMVGAYQLWVPGGQAHVVVAQSEPASEPSIIVDVLARADVSVVAAVTSRRTADVVAAVAPGTTKVEYRARAGAVWSVVDQDSLDLVFPRGASPGAGEALRTSRNGVQVITPLQARRVEGASVGGAPDNVVAWPGRGIVSEGPSVQAVARAYAQARKARTAQVRRLFSGRTDSGVRYLIGQAWVAGEPAHTVGYVVHPSQEWELLIQPPTPQGTRVVGLLVTALPGTSTDLLVVVPEPRTTQVSYRMTSSASWRPAYTDAHLDGVNLVDRSRSAAGDSLQIMTGNGDPASPSTQVITVATLLCNGANCS